MGLTARDNCVSDSEHLQKSNRKAYCYQIPCILHTYTQLLLSVTAVFFLFGILGSFEAQDEQTGEL